MASAQHEQIVESFVAVGIAGVGACCLGVADVILDPIAVSKRI